MTDYANLLAQHDYALVDRGALYPESWHSHFPLIPLVPRQLHDRAATLPGLLALKSLDDASTTRLIENLHAAQAGEEEPLVSSLLVTHGSEQASIQTHLERRFDTSSVQGRFLLRYYDPRTFIHFERILTLPWLRGMYGPICGWTIPFQDAWLTLPAPEVGLTVSAWVVTREMREEIDRIGSVNMALKKLRKHLGRPWRDLAEYTGFAAQADKALITGVREGLKVPNDLIAFAFHTLAYGEGFHHYPCIQRVLEKARQNSSFGYAGAAITMVSEQEWADIAATADDIRSR